MKNLIRFFLLLIISATSGYSQVLFSVNGTPVNADEFKYVYSKNSFNNDKAFTKSDIEDYLDLFINFKLKVANAKTNGLDTLKALITEYNSYKDQLKKPYLTDQKMMDQLINEAYDRLHTEVHASHILIQIPENATPQDTLKAWSSIIGIRNRAVSGEPFNQLAAKFSQDPSATVNGGDLGYFTSMQMVFEFENAAYQTPVGDISMPIRTRFGYHIIKVYDKRESPGTVKVAHIMLRFNPQMSTGDSLALRDKIFEIKDQLNSGFDWNELCKNFSEDPSTRNKGGEIRPFGLRVMPPTFEAVSFSLEEGQISDPFTTSFGWHIVKMIDKIGLQPFSEMESIIRSRINSDGRAQMQQHALIQRLKSENGFVVNKENEQQFLNHLNDSPKDLPLASIGKTVLTSQSALQFNKQINRQSLDQFYEKEILKYEEQLLPQKYPEFRFLMNEYWEGILLFQIMDQNVWGKASADSAGLASFFEKNRQNYKWEQRFDVVILESKDKAALEAIKPLLSDSSFSSEVLKKEFEKKSTQTIQITEGAFEIGSPVLNAPVKAEIGTYETTIGDLNRIICIRNIEKSVLKSLSEVRGLVISDYQDYLDREWIAKLHKQYTVVKNKKNIKNVIKEISK